MVRDTKNPLGEIIKSARVKNKLTQEKFAEKSNVSARYVMSIENEGKKPSYDKLHRMIRVLGINANDIFYPENREEDTPAQYLSRLLSQCGERDIRGITALVETFLSEKE